MRFAVLSEIPMYTLFKGLGDIAEIGKTRSDRTSVRCGGRALLGGSEKIFCSKAEHSGWPAEKIFSKCGICVEFRLSSVDSPELDKICSDRTSVRRKGRALSAGPIGMFTSKAERSDWSAEKNLLKSEICVESCLSSVDSPELGKICSDLTSVRWEGCALSGGPIAIFTSKAERSDWLAEKSLSKCGICAEFRLCSADQAELS